MLLAPVDRHVSAMQPPRDRRARAPRRLSGASWSEPSKALKEEGLLGTLQLSLEQPILFHLVAEAARLHLEGRGALSVLNRSGRGDRAA